MREEVKSPNHGSSGAINTTADQNSRQEQVDSEVKPLASAAKQIVIDAAIRPKIPTTRTIIKDGAIG